MNRAAKDDIAAGIDKRVKGLLEPRIGVQAYKVTRTILIEYINELLSKAESNG